MNSIVATTSLYGQKPGEERVEITVAIGMPYQCGNDPEEWACPVQLRPLYQRLHDAHGENSFQALCLAIALVQDLLAGFKESGGLLTFDDGDEFPLDAYSFGIAVRRGEAAP